MAIYLKEPEMVKYFLQHGASPLVKDSEDWSAIYTASNYGYTDIVRMLAEAKADPNERCTNEMWTALHAANEFPETVRVLLQYGADMTKISASSLTPLDVSIEENQPKTIQVFLKEAKTTPDLSQIGTQRALQNAVAWGYTEVVGMVLEAGADVNAVDEDNYSLLSLAMMVPDAATVRKILEYSPDVLIGNHNQNTALHSIYKETPVESVRLVVNAGGRLEALNKNGVTPLICAIRAGNEEVFNYMLTKKATLRTLHDTPLQQTGTALHAACRYGSVGMVRSLIEHGMDVNVGCEGQHGTPLISATIRRGTVSFSDQKEIIMLLLDKGADPAILAGVFGYPIISGSLACHEKVVKLCLGSNASIDVKDPMGRKPAHLACYNSLSVLNLLQVPGSDFAVRDIVGRVPLHYAVLSGQVELVEDVLARSARVGVGIDVQDNDGWTPLLWAARASITQHQATSRDRDPSASEVVSLLLEKGADPTIEGDGFYLPCTALQVAYYHHADRYVTQ